MVDCCYIFKLYTHSVATPFVLSVLFDADILAADAATEAVKLFVPFYFRYFSDMWKRRRKKEREAPLAYIDCSGIVEFYIHFLFSPFDGSMGRHFLPPISLSLFFIFIDPVGVRIGDNGAVFYFAPTTAHNAGSSFHLFSYFCVGVWAAHFSEKELSHWSAFHAFLLKGRRHHLITSLWPCFLRLDIRCRWYWPRIWRGVAVPLYVRWTESKRCHWIVPLPQNLFFLAVSSSLTLAHSAVLRFFS